MDRVAKGPWPWRQKGRWPYGDQRAALVTLQFAVARIGAILITVNINYKTESVRPQAVRVGEHLNHRWIPGHGLRQHDVRAGA